MTEYTVMCDRCGERFDAKTEGYYNRKTRQYLCPDCANKVLYSGGRHGYIWEAALDALLKLLFGMILIEPVSASAGESVEDPISNTVLGLFLIGWAALTFAKALKLKKTLPSIAEMLFKVIIGALFFAIGFDMESVEDVLICAILGFAVVLWGILPYVIARKRERERRNLISASAEAEISMVRICPHCGATSRGGRCEYCGSAF